MASDTDVMLKLSDERKVIYSQIYLHAFTIIIIIFINNKLIYMDIL